MKKCYSWKGVLKTSFPAFWMVVLLCCWHPSAFSQTVTLTGNVVYRPYSTNTNFVVPGKTDVHFTADDSAYANCTIALNSNDAWLFYDNIRPEKVISSYLNSVTINGAAASNGTSPNVRIAIYKNGTAVIPNGNLTSQAALQVFKQRNLTGSSQTYAVQTIHSSLGAFDNGIRSFKLKRGYMATFANGSDGFGYSRVFVANDSDLVVNAMPTGLDTTVSFIRVFPWNWTSKKGKAGWSPDLIGATWYYDWNIGGNSTAANYEYAAIRQNGGWPNFWDIANKPNVNQLLGFNEPDRPDQSNLSQDFAIGQWPELMKTGQRLGSPAPSDGFNGWLRPFLDKAEALNYRVDYVAIHCYWGGFTPQQWYDRLLYLYNLFGHRPLWITEWNNGANWTSEWWPSNQADQLQKQLDDMRGILQVLDTASFVERYAEYDWVEDKRALVLADTLTPAGKYYFANKSDFAYKPSMAYITEWKLVASTLSSTIQDTNYFKVNISWPDLNGEMGGKYLLERKVEGRNSDFVPVQYFSNYAIGSTISFMDSVYGRATYRLRNYGKDTTITAYSATLEVVRDIAAAAPTPAGTVVSSSKLRLNWSNVVNARSYNLKRSTFPNGPFDTVLLARTTANTFLDENLTPGKKYYYVMSSLNSAGESANSPVLTVTMPNLAAPAATQNPRAASGDTKVTLTWDFQYDAKYKIVRSASEYGPFDTIATNLATLRFVDSNRTNSTAYYYKILAYNDSGYSATNGVLMAKPIQGQHLYISVEDTASAYTSDAWGGFHAQFSGAATRTAGKYGQALSLNGTTNTFATLDEGAVKGLNNYTISTWVKFSSLSNWMRIFDFGTSNGSFMFLTPQYYIDNGKSVAMFSIKNSTADQNVSFPVAWSLDTWTHVAITQSNDSTKFFVNGVQIFATHSITLRPDNLGSTTQNYLGKSQFNDPLFNGAIDEFRMYNYALSTAEVATLYGTAVVTPPVAVLAPRVASGDAKTTLTWTVQSGITHSIVRSLSASGPYDTIASNLTGARYVDMGKTNGTTYYYKILAFNGGGSIASPIIAATPKTGQYLYLSFNDATTGLSEDAWGAYHAQFYGAATRGTNSAGKYLTLNAATDTYVSLGDTTVKGLNNYTISTWVKCTSMDNWMRIFDFGNGTGSFMFLTPQYYTDNGLSVGMFSIKNSTADQNMSFSAAWNLNTWTHIAVTQSNDSTKIFINGTQVASRAGITLRPSDLGATTQNFLGKSQFNDPLFNGSIDEFRIYNYALSTAEIQTVYGTNVPMPAPMAVLTPRVASGDGRATLAWAAQSDVMYKIMRSTSASGPYDTIATNVTAVRYVDANRTNNSTYYYKVLAYNIAGSSPATTNMMAKPTAGQHVNISFDDTDPSMATDTWNAYDATLAAAATRETGKVGTALRLNGTAESYTNLYSGVVSELTNFTISTWARANSLADWMRIFDFGTGTDKYMFLTVQAGTTGGQSNIRYAIKNGGGEQIVNYPYTLPLNTWVHYAITQSGNTARLFINGTLVGTNTNVIIKPADLGTTYQNYLGKAQYNDPLFNGTIDEFRIYNYALTDAEVMNLTTPVILPISSLNFKGRTTPAGNLLEWNLNTNSEAMQMQLERSVDARQFVGLYHTTTARSNATQSFSYTDATAKAPVVCYRLKLTGQDSKITYSPVVALSTTVKGIELVGLYPTITQTNALLSVAASKPATVLVVVTNLQGRTVQSAKHTLVAGGNLLNIDAANLASGSYFVSVYENDNRVGTPLRLIVNR